MTTETVFDQNGNAIPLTGTFVQDLVAAGVLQSSQSNPAIFQTLIFGPNQFGALEFICRGGFWSGRECVCLEDRCAGTCTPNIPGQPDFDDNFLVGTQCIGLAACCVVEGYPGTNVNPTLCTLEPCVI
jgi:hypothetical protein